MLPRNRGKNNRKELPETGKVYVSQPQPELAESCRMCQMSDTTSSSWHNIGVKPCVKMATERL